VIDVATDRVESPEEVARLIESVASHIPIDRIYPSTNCGMVPLGRELSNAKMRALAQGAGLVG
jgi:5-methyltetrahydropteroyltriglutamate--homocysteine methyltransferase